MKYWFSGNAICVPSSFQFSCYKDTIKQGYKAAIITLNVILHSFRLLFWKKINKTWDMSIPLLLGAITITPPNTIYLSLSNRMILMKCIIACMIWLSRGSPGPKCVNDPNKSLDSVVECIYHDYKKVQRPNGTSKSSQLTLNYVCIVIFYVQRK